MVRKCITGLILFMFISVSTMSFAQFSLGGGPTTFHGLNLPIHRYGINMFGEFPRAPNNTFLIRAAYLLPHKGNVLIQAPDVFGGARGVVKTTYFAVDGGTRYYFFNDYDIGTSMYAGGYIKGIISSYNAYRVDDTTGMADMTNNDSYYYPETASPLYSVLFAFGGTIGVKHQLTRGALMFDVGIELISRLIDPAAILGNDISPLSFNFNLAYRFDWY